MDVHRLQRCYSFTQLDKDRDSVKNTFDHRESIHFSSLVRLILMENR